MAEGRELIIATAPGRKSKTWTNRKVPWLRFLEKLQKVTRTGETMAEYRRMTKAQKDARKDVGGFVGGYLEGGKRRKGHVKHRDLLTLDLDNAPKLDELKPVLQKLGCALMVYPTHSSTENMPRYRVIMPLSRQTTSEEYEPVARRVAESIGMDYMDSTTYEPERLMYWPSVPSDADATTYSQAGEWLDVDAVLGSYEDWHDASTWPIGKSEAEAHVRTMQKLGDPKGKNGAVGLFCQAYTIREAMEVFIPDVYKPVLGDENRFTYAGGTTTGGAIIYDEVFLCSHHDTDPAGGGHEVNAFDMVRLHKFGGLDADVSEDTAITQRPSYKKMAELVYNDERVKTLQLKDDIARMNDDLIDLGVYDDEENPLPYDPKNPPKWALRIERTKAGEPKSSATNVLLILRNDPRVTGLIGRDLFSDRLTVLKRLPWEKKTQIGRVWTDADDSQLRNWYMDRWQIAHKGAIDDGLAEMAEKFSFHPVRDYFKGLPKWDGFKRAAKLFIKILGADDTKYNRAVTELWLKEAVARILHPGIKADLTLVLSGPQGIGKSTVLARLGGPWYSDSLKSVQGKEAMVGIQGCWIIEVGELQGFNRASTEEIKAFLTSLIDKFRPPYGRRVQEFPRQCVFAATTNDDIFLKDRTGGRRFGIITCKGIQDPKEKREALASLTQETIDQIWAEVLVMYKEAPSLTLPDDVLDEAQRVAEEHTEGAEKAGLIQDYLDMPRPQNWDDMSIADRRQCINGEGDFDQTLVKDDKSDWQPPQKICAMEILCELFGMDKRNIRSLDIREVNTIMQHMPGWKKHEAGVGILKFSLYGKQRAYVRESIAGEQEMGNKVGNKDS